MDKQGIPDIHCWLVLAEYLKEEQQDADNRTWETVMEWMKFAHQAEIAELQSQVLSQRRFSRLAKWTLQTKEMIMTPI